MMRPSQKKIDDLKNDKEAVEEINHCLSASMLLRTLAKGYEDQANALLSKHGLILGETKQCANECDKVYDRYIAYMKGLFVNPDTAGEELGRDFDNLMKIIEDNLGPLIKNYIQ
jgi:hypothetical protein